jgi:hypothetical protein
VVTLDTTNVTEPHNNSASPDPGGLVFELISAGKCIKAGEMPIPADVGLGFLDAEFSYLTSRGLESTVRRRTAGAVWQKR